ncbi:MAG: hypothetical protein HUU47_05280 [Bacteroidetes bacterium]|nr:hypothetical protein [Bacteroidota bacterium]
MNRKILLLLIISLFVNKSQAQKNIIKNFESCQFTIFNNQTYLPFTGVKN